MDHEVDLRTCIPDGDFYTHGNGYRLEQVLLNVLSNAKYAVEERDKLKYEQYNKLIMISLDSVGDKNVIIIEDNGIGIDSKIIHQIFNPFFTTKSEEKGTGLGLSISYGIIKEMRGDIRVESEVGLFTKVFITLPKV
jgi:signal transduction histidine kinase